MWVLLCSPLPLKSKHYLELYKTELSYYLNEVIKVMTQRCQRTFILKELVRGTLLRCWDLGRDRKDSKNLIRWLADKHI